MFCSNFNLERGSGVDRHCRDSSEENKRTRYQVAE